MSVFQLVVAKCWDPNPKDYFSVPRTEPVRPIDPGAWVAHTAAVRAAQLHTTKVRRTWPTPAPNLADPGTGAAALRDR